MSISFSQKTHGSVLIMVLWALGLLTVFTIQISMTLQDKIAFLSRADRHQLLRTTARAGIYKAIAVIKNEPRSNKLGNPLQRLLMLYNNPGSFGEIIVGQLSAEVTYANVNSSGKLYGVTDEERRLNLNFADRQNIKKLFSLITNFNEEEISKIAGNIVDWHQYGETEIEGFYSDDVYENLEFPYKEKKAPYETLDELRLVGRIDEKLFATLLDYVTIYGTGAVNINTAPWQILVALGFSNEQAKIITEIRRGVDGKDGTLDDFIFPDINVLTEKLIEALEMKEPEIEELHTLMSGLKLITESSIFRIQSQTLLPSDSPRSSSREIKSITCVFNSNNDKIIYWREY